ncbi:hypothetical protein BIFPSEUDO_03857 [Bifidobacterium pseudocatenulatum DSM 20438 = JCM 1200 = LMG 10505]|uniref:Uncharacterized protein n=1 Tax=Bifidobacterium pseudocatenulatum DSM 20438 = JCM 1200 = LMG 10505 TaxID=547043 RepID=C0BTX6_BIFPS|nr:hypothetical protein BIFPSEUDO_03857 [Bifidobacterium pseudocatenulatum DSM 20438 = JCM 1200 = LMG 10505]
MFASCGTIPFDGRALAHFVRLCHNVRRNAGEPVFVGLRWAK